MMGGGESRRGTCLPIMPIQAIDGVVMVGTEKSLGGVSDSEILHTLAYSNGRVAGRRMLRGALKLYPRKAALGSVPRMIGPHEIPILSQDKEP